MRQVKATIRSPRPAQPRPFCILNRIDGMPLKTTPARLCRNRAPADRPPPAGARPARASIIGCFSIAFIVDCARRPVPRISELGNENDSPRGRIYLMRAVTDGRLPRDARSAPAFGTVPRLPGLRNGLPLRRAIRPADRAVPRRHGAIRRKKSAKATTGFTAGFCSDCFRYPDRMRRSLVWARIAQRLGLLTVAAETLGLMRLLPPRLRRLARMLPPPAQVRAGAASRFCRPIGRRRARVALFTGCVADVMFRHTHWATARVLQAKRLRRARAAESGLLRGDSLPRRREPSRPRIGRREPGGVRPSKTATRSSSTWPAAARCSRIMAITGTTPAGQGRGRIRRQGHATSTSFSTIWG